MREAMEPPSLPEVVIEAAALTKGYESGPPAIRNLSFTVNRGEIYCLLGGRGAGKTTVVDLVLGLRVPTSGTLAVAGLDPGSRPSETRRLICFADGAADLFPSLSPFENVRLFMALARGGGAPAFPAVAIVNALRDAGIADRDIDVRLSTLPPDAHVATALAIGLLRESTVVVLDDPAVRLESRAIARFEETLELFRRRRAAVLLTTTDVLLAGQVADRIGILKGGEKVDERSRIALLGQRLTEFIGEYMGRSTGATERTGLGRM